MKKRLVIDKATPRLTEEHPEWRAFEVLHRCHLCGAASSDGAGFKLYRECDEHDQPIEGLFALLVVCGARACQERVQKHVRLYADEPHTPGRMTFCGDCVHRRVVECAHPDLRANGGGGLRITFHRMRGWSCGPRGCMQPLPELPTECVGRSVKP